MTDMTVVSVTAIKQALADRDWQILLLTTQVEQQAARIAELERVERDELTAKSDESAP